MSKRMIKLGDIATYINGYAFKPEDRGESGLPIIRIQDLTGNAYNLGFYNGDYPMKIEINNGDIICEIISAVRGEKSNNNLSLKTEVKLLDLSLNKNLMEAINSMIQDFKATLFIDELVLNEIEENYLINKIELNV